ncbi:MAG: MarR family transcriptional regulator [Gammaproteobacteria bacterium]
MTTPAETELFIKLANLQTLFQKRMTAALSVHGISLTEYLVLGQLSQAPEKKLRRIDLAQAVGLTPSGVTRLLNPMEKIGLVCKEAGARDARVSLVAIASAGETIFRESGVTFAETAKELLVPLERKDRDDLYRIATKLL